MQHQHEVLGRSVDTRGDPELYPRRTARVGARPWSAKPDVQKLDDFRQKTLIF